MGIGYKVIWDEVPLNTHPYAPEAKAVIAVGPLTATGVPCGGRTNISFLTNFTRGASICDAHMGGHFSQYMKYAGYDAIIIEGRSATPVYLKIDDARVTLESATHLWGRGTFETNKSVIDACGPEFTSAAIGIAGENLVNYSTLHTSQGNSGGAGIGAVLGSKNLKAIACRGTGNVKIADPAKLMELSEYMLTQLIGGNNNHNVPQRPQSWAEFTHVGNGRWQGGPGIMWGANVNGPVDTGEQPYWDKNRIAYRTFKGMWGHGTVSPEAVQRYTVKTAGCAFCPVRCYENNRMDPLARIGQNAKTTMACLTRTAMANFYPNAANAVERWNNMDLGVPRNENSLLINAHATKVMDDLGLWENYMSLAPDFHWCLNNGYFEPVSRGGIIPDAEHREIRWDLMNTFSPEWLNHLFTRIARNQGELAQIGSGSYNIAKRWNLPSAFWNDPRPTGVSLITHNGYPSHHILDAQQASMLHNVLYNRDNMVHCIVNFVGCGLPFNRLIEVVESHFGRGCMDQGPAQGFTPVNESKINLARWAFLHKNWHDMATICDWIWPMTMSPSRDRGYKGDIDLEGKFMTAVTGENWDTAKVHLHCERVSAMLRVMTAISFNIHEGATSLRDTHDVINDFWFDRDPGRQPFTPGTAKLDRADMNRSFDMFYDRMGWDRRTGIPTRATLVRLGLSDMAEALRQRGLLSG
jgi:aldehyde:ferredoxin oxidoreductase